MDGYPVKIDDVLTTTELEAFILKLSLQRAAMAPPVPTDVPDSGIPTVQRASFSIDIAPDGITINLRSNGLGWLGYQINRDGCIGLRDALNAYFPPILDPNNLRA